MKENCENAARLAEIWTDDLPNMSQECCCVTMMFGNKYELNINTILFM